VLQIPRESSFWHTESTPHGDAHWAVFPLATLTHFPDAQSESLLHASLSPFELAEPPPLLLHATKRMAKAARYGFRDAHTMNSSYTCQP
jgi:hypothetical protein